MPETLTKPLVIYSQLGAELDSVIAGQSPAYVVRGAQAGDKPWDLPPDVDVLLARPFVVWGNAPTTRPETWPGSLKWIIVSSTGVDFFPPWLLEGPPVACGRGVNAEPIAEYVLGAILQQAKRFEAIRMRGPADFKRLELEGLSGKVLGLAGFGALGQAIVPLARAFGMRVLAFKRTAWGDVPAGVEPVATIGELAEQSDHLVLALPATPETRHIVDATVFQRAKRGQHLVNIARGSLVDQDALIAALDTGQLSFATLDVTDPEPLAEGHPLYQHPKVLVTPHVSWQSALNGPRLTAKILGELDRISRGLPLADLVDPNTRY
jgi:phosphoglycerate dehydrogenase-like enzyme